MPSAIPVIGTTLVSVTERIDERSTVVWYSSEPTLTLSGVPGDLGNIMALPEHANDQDSTYMIRERQLAWTALTYQRLRKTCLQQICALNQAYRLWALEDDNVFATVLNPS